MRNIRVADRSEWVINQPPNRPAGRSSRSVDWLATLPILLLIPAILLPLVSARGAMPRITATPEVAAPGATIRVTGVGFPKGSRGSIVLDETTTLGNYRVQKDGSFKVALKIPGTTVLGAHILSATAAGLVLASAVLSIADGSGLSSTAPSAAPSAGASGGPIPSASASAAPSPSASSPAASTPAPAPSTAPSAPPAASNAPAPSASAPATPAPPPVAAGTFYVATNGNDGNNGSIGAPWRTFAKAAATVPAGSTVLGRAGTYAPFTVTRSGTESSPIRFGAYPGETVTIQGTAARDTVILVTGAHDIVIDGLIVQGAPSQYGAGIRVENSTRVTVERSTLRENRSFGIKIADSTLVTVQSNDIGGNETGIEISRAGSGVVVDANDIHDNDRMVSSSRGGNGIVFHLTTGRIVVSNNRVWGNRARHLNDAGYDGGAFEVYGASNLVISGNVLWNNNNAMETGTDGTPCAGNTFSRNIVRALGTVAGETTGMILRCAENMLVAHNTFDGLDHYAFYVSQSGGYAGSVAGLRIIDNAVIRGRAYSLDSGLPSGLVIDYNISNPGGSSATYGDHLAYVRGFGNTDDIAEFRQWTGFDSHGLKEDPRFVNVSSGDYHLRSDSPAIDQGTGYGQSYSGAAPDPGRFEWSP